MRSAFLFVLLALALLIPGLAFAGPADPCNRIAGLTELERSERATLEDNCRNNEHGKVDKLVKVLLRHGDWRAHVGIGLLPTSEPKDSAEPQDSAEGTKNPEDLLEKILAHPACEQLQRDFRVYVHATRSSRHPRPDEQPNTPVPWLGSDVPKKCMSPEEVTKLRDWLAERWMLAFIGLDKDELDIHALPAARFDGDSLPGRRIVPAIDYFVPTPGGTEQIAIAWLKKDEYVVAKVDQHDLDVDWFVSKMMRDDDVYEPRADGCLIVEVGNEDKDLVWYAIVGGTPLALDRSSAEETYRGVFRALPEVDDVVLVARNETTSEWVWASDATIKPAAKGQACRELRSDLRGVSRPHEPRYGITRIWVDDQCGELGLTQARVLRYVEHYLTGADAKFELLETWADAVAVLRQLDEDLAHGSAVGATRRELDIGDSLSTAAAELRRHGVNVLLDLEVRCAGANPDPSVTGRTIDLGKFSYRQRSQLMGVDTSGLIEVRTHTKPINELRAALDVVLSHLLERAQPRLNTIDSHVKVGTREVLTAVAEVRGAHDGDDRMELRVMRLSNLEAIATCELIGRSNELASVEDFAELSSRLKRWGEAWVASESAAGPGCEAKSATGLGDGGSLDGARAKICASSPLDQATTSLSAELGGLRAGNYLAYAWIASRNSANSDFVATCFDVVEDDLSLFTSFSGIVGARGRLNSDTNLQLGELRRERVIHLQALFGGRYTAPSIFEFGFELGYTYSKYHADDWPSWDNLAIPAQPEADNQLQWDRHGVLVGGFMGARFPFSRCFYRSSRTCPGSSSRVSAFLRLHVRENIGLVTDVRVGDQLIGLPSGQQAFNADLDISLNGGLSYRPRNGVQMSVWIGTLWSDISQGIKAIRKPDVASHLTYDYNITPMLGFETAWTTSTRSNSR